MYDKKILIFSNLNNSHNAVFKSLPLNETIPFICWLKLKLRKFRTAKSWQTENKDNVDF